MEYFLAMFHFTDPGATAMIGADSRCPSPLCSDHHGLWSLWDMLNLYAYSVVAVMRQLREGAEHLEAVKAVVAPVPMANGGPVTMIEVGINCALSLANELGMISTQQQVMTLVTLMMKRCPISEFLIEINQLLRRIEEDLRRVNFLSVRPDLVPYWNAKDLFGDAVIAKFKNGADIDSAGQCLVAGQGTACVFHLMRAMEAAVRKIGKRTFGITITPKTTWRVLTGNMTVKIAKMPGATDVQMRKKNAWAEACANLHHVGSVWRNTTMHPAESYTPSQAREIFDAMRVVMISLAAL